MSQQHTLLHTTHLVKPGPSSKTDPTEVFTPLAGPGTGRSHIFLKLILNTGLREAGKRHQHSNWPTIQHTFQQKINKLPTNCYANEELPCSAMSIYPKRKDSSFMPLRRTSCHSEAALLNFKQLYVEKRGNHESGLLWSCFSLVIVLSSAYDIVPESELVHCSTNEGSVHRPHSIRSSKSFSQGKITYPSPW